MADSPNSILSRRLTEQERFLLAELVRQPGWQLYLQGLREYRDSEANRLRTLNESADLFRSQGAVTAYEKAIDLPASLLHSPPKARQPL